ncbi:MAG: hypothetical protein IAG10_20100 [Planctomycetaceae bacterium]|nr:hypothetical protein [Planctomycetaceae bacterium]
MFAGCEKRSAKIDSTHFEEDHEMFRHPFRHALLATSFIFFGMTLGAAPAFQEKTVEGTVLRTSDTQLVLRVNSTSAIQRFAVAADAVIRRDGQNAKLNDIKLGDLAVVSAKDDEPLPIATAIAAISPQYVRTANLR